MSRKYKLLIADDEPFICSMLAKIIRCGELGIEIVGMAYDGEDALRQIRELSPDIVITDISMPKMDGLELIRSAREAGISCRFVIITGYQQYRYAYDSLRYDADDYLVKPVDEEELNAVMMKITGSLRVADAETAGKSYEAIRAAFVKDGVYESRTSPASLDAINERFHLRLREGLFRLVSVRLEQSETESGGGEYAATVINKLHELIDSMLAEFCYDIAFLESVEGVVAFLNYGAELDGQVRGRFNALLQKAKGAVSLFQGMGITVCVGAAADEPALLWQAKNSVRDAEWARIFYGTDRVIYSDELPSVPNEAFRLKLLELFDEFSRAFKELDIPEFRRCASSLFSCPMNVLRSKETRDFCRKLLDEFFELNSERIRAFADPVQMDRSTREKLGLCTKVTAYTDAFVSVLSGNMQAITEYERSRETGLFTELEALLYRRCSQSPSAVSAAGELGTDAATLEGIVRRETGRSFEEYLSAFRVSRAQAMLKEGRKPDREMARELGYASYQAFGREFKSALGVKPEGYRKIFQ